MRARRLTTISFAFLFVVAACGGSSTATSGASGATGTAAAPGSTNGGGSAPTVDMPAAGSGTCRIAITGDETKAWQITQTQGTLLLSQWLTSSSRGLLSLADGEESMILNCGSDQGAVSLTMSQGTTSSEFPEGPGTYPISADLIGATSAGAQVDLLLDTKDQKVWSVEEPGTFTVTTFGVGRFVGSFAVKVVTTLDGGNHSQATLTGSFDLGCTGDACN